MSTLLLLIGMWKLIGFSLVSNCMTFYKDCLPASFGYLELTLWYFSAHWWIQKAFMYHITHYEILQLCIYHYANPPHKHPWKYLLMHWFAIVWVWLHKMVHTFPLLVICMHTSPTIIIMSSYSTSVRLAQ